MLGDNQIAFPHVKTFSDLFTVGPQSQQHRIYSTWQEISQAWMTVDTFMAVSKLGQSYYSLTERSLVVVGWH